MFRNPSFCYFWEYFVWYFGKDITLTMVLVHSIAWVRLDSDIIGVIVDSDIIVDIVDSVIIVVIRLLV